MSTEESSNKSYLYHGFKLLRWLFYLLLGLVLILFLDLYTFQLIVRDPGYYVVARRSDTPRQVLRALDKLKEETVSDTELITLRSRYQKKMSAPNRSQKKQKIWRQAYKKTRALLRARQNADKSP